MADDASKLVNDWFTANPDASASDVASVVQNNGGMTSELASAIAQHYGTDANTIQNSYTKLIAPSGGSSTTSQTSTDQTTYTNPSQVLNDLQSGALDQSSVGGALQQVAQGDLSQNTNPSPLSLVSTNVDQGTTPYSSDKAPAKATDSNPYFNETYNSIQYGNTKITTVDVPDQETGSTSQKLALLDPQGNPLPPDNIVDLGNGIYDLQIGSGAGGGRNHIYVKADPDTGVVSPIQDYNAQVNYQGGDKGGFINQTVKGFSSLPGVNMAVAIAAPEFYPYLQGMNALNSYNNGNILGALSSGFGAYTGLTGNNPLLTNKGIEQVNTSGMSTDTIKNINTGLGVATAIQQKNPLALVNLAMQQTDTKLPTEVGAGLKLASAYISYQKGDGQALINQVMGFAKSTNPVVSSSAQKAIDDIKNGIDGKVALDNFSKNVGLSSDVTNAISNLSPDQLTQSGYGNTVTTTAGLATDQNPLGTPFT